MDNFIEVTDTQSGLTQRVPRDWLEDPVLGRFITKTPNQRALDGELGQVPDEDASIEDLRAFAVDAEVDIAGLRKKADIRARIVAAVGNELPEAQAVGVDVEVPSGMTDPSYGEGGEVGEATVSDTTGATLPAGTTSTAPSPGTAETPATGDQGEI